MGRRGDISRNNGGQSGLSTAGSLPPLNAEARGWNWQDLSCRSPPIRGCSLQWQKETSTTLPCKLLLLSSSLRPPIAWTKLETRRQESMVHAVSRYSSKEHRGGWRVDLKGQTENIKRLRLPTGLFTEVVFIIVKNQEEPKCPLRGAFYIL